MTLMRIYCAGFRYSSLAAERLAEDIELETGGVDFFLTSECAVSFDKLIDEQEELFEEFNIWLAKNEFTDFYKVGFAEPTGKCKDLEKFSHLWYYNKCDKDT